MSTKPTNGEAEKLRTPRTSCFVMGVARDEPSPSRTKVLDYRNRGLAFCCNAPSLSVGKNSPIRLN